MRLQATQVHHEFWQCSLCLANFETEEECLRVEGTLPDLPDWVKVGVPVWKSGEEAKISEIEVVNTTRSSGGHAHLLYIRLEKIDRDGPWSSGPVRDVNDLSFSLRS